MSRIIMLVLLLVANPLLAEHLEQDKLLRAIQASDAGTLSVAEEAAFLADKTKQAGLIAAARTELSQQAAKNLQLQTQVDANAKQIEQLEAALAEKSGSLGELFAVARQVAGDLKAALTHSIISAQFPNRTARLEAIAENKALPTLAQLEHLWFTLQQEMTESGKVVFYQGNLLSAAGEPRQAKVVRIGAFNALADGQYLRYLPETGKLSDLPRQPDSKYLSLAEAFSTTVSGQAPIALDPTRGSILGMLIQSPSVTERITQGGLIGYITITLGVLGFLYGLYRLAYLLAIGNKMTQQMQSTQLRDDNPLGRLLAIAENSASEDTDNLELLLDEGLTREVPVLEKGLALIKLIAAVGPLLGLLGTVTGMIVTFQSISLFGTGDPKLMAEGISQALVTTVIGLCVAIPLLFLHSVVAARSRTLVQILDEQTAGLISRRAGY